MTRSWHRSSEKRNQTRIRGDSKTHHGRTNSRIWSYRSALGIPNRLVLAAQPALLSPLTTPECPLGAGGRWFDPVTAHRLNPVWLSEIRQFERRERCLTERASAAICAHSCPFGAQQSVHPIGNVAVAALEHPRVDLEAERGRSVAELAHQEPRIGAGQAEHRGERSAQALATAMRDRRATRSLQLAVRRANRPLEHARDETAAERGPVAGRKCESTPVHRASRRAVQGQ
jgi:hypothetical protein